MNINQYISNVKERFGGKAEQVKIKETDALLLKDKYECLFGLQGAKHHIYLHMPNDNGTVNLEYVKRYCETAQEYTEQFFPINRFLRGFKKWSASTIPVIISESGFSDNAKYYVRTTKFAKYGKICLPILIDIKQQQITLLENFGVFGKPLLEELTRYFRRKLSLEDRVEE